MNADKKVKQNKSRTAKAPSTGRRAAKHSAPAQKHGKKSVRTKHSANRISRLFRRIGAWFKKPRNPANMRALKWLWCFPVGLSMMWRSACTWKRGVKVGISAAMAAILLAVFLIPESSVKTRVGGVELVSAEPEVEVYGPALPTLIVPGYTKENKNSIIVEQNESNAHYVYAADDARCYHEYECKFAFASSQRLTVYEAYFLGFEPCGRCNPPVYTPGVTDPVTAEPIGGTVTQPAAEQPVEGETSEIGVETTDASATA